MGKPPGAPWVDPFPATDPRYAKRWRRLLTALVIVATIIVVLATYLTLRLLPFQVLELSHPALVLVGAQHSCRTAPILHTIIVCFNPANYTIRPASVRGQQKRLAATAGVIAYTVELAYGGAPFSVTDASNPRHLQLRYPAGETAI